MTNMSTWAEPAPGSSAPNCLAVIGGGSVGTSFIAQLALSLGKAGPRPAIERLVLFEPKDTPGAGVAYQMDTPSNLLNTCVSTMSPFAEDPLHFFRWLKKHPDLWKPIFPTIDPAPDAFLPRPLFGLYLDHVYADAVQRLNALGVQVEHVRTQASAVRKLRDGAYEVSCGQGARALADGVVLALGNLASNQWGHLQEHSGYFNTPYPCQDLASRIGPQDTVGIIGSSLSAIDAAVSLADAGHRGPIVMVSRNGRLPSVRGVQNIRRAPQFLTRDSLLQMLDRQGPGSATLAEIGQLLLGEIELSEGKAPDLRAILRTGAGPQRYLDCEIADAQANDRAWQAIVYGLNDSIDLIWHLLRTEEKREFQARFKSQWHSYRVSFPVENARKLQNLLHCGQLTVYAGYRDAHFDDVRGRFAIDIGPDGPGFQAMLFADHLVNATGYTDKVQQAYSPLLRSMMVAGLVCPCEFGGIDLHFSTGRVMSRSGAQMQGLFALGSLGAGTYFWTNAMNVNARLASAAIPQVLQDLSSRAQARQTPPCPSTPSALLT